MSSARWLLRSNTQPTLRLSCRHLLLTGATVRTAGYLPGVEGQARGVKGDTGTCEGGKGEPGALKSSPQIGSADRPGNRRAGK